MIKPLASLLIPVFIYQFSNAQSIGTPYPKDKELIAEGVELHDAEKYADALAKYKQVNPNDSFYSAALQEMATSYMANKQYDLAAEAALKGLRLNDKSRREFIINYANALEELGKTDSALATYNMGLREFPYFGRYQYEKGLTLAKQKRYKEAMDAYIESMKNNIFHPATHYRLGLLAADAKQPAIALLAMQTFMILNTNKSSAGHAITLMEKIAGNEYSSELVVPESMFGNEQEMKEIDEIILSKAALSKKYKSIVKLDIWIVKQVQVTLEKLPDNFKSQNEAVNMYVKLYKDIWKNNHFEGMMLQSLQGVENKDIDKAVKANKTKIDAFIKWIKPYLDNLRNDREVVLNGKKVKTKLWYEGNSLIAMGDENTAGNPVGYWQYYQAGRLSSEGNFNSTSKKTGKWVYYYYNGNVRTSEHFDGNGILTGAYESYYDNGNIEEKSTYKNDMFDGEVLLYHANGALRSKLFYKGGKRNGVRTNYNQAGQIENEGMQVNGDYSGDYKTFHPNGQPDMVCKTLNGNISGAVTYYFKNGKVRTTGSFTEGNRTGLWKWFYENGTPQSEGSYANNNQVGKWVYYYESGKVKEEANFENGKLKGIDRSYDDNGKVWDETTYKNGKAESYKIFDENGGIIVQNKTSGGKLKLVNYNKYRQKTAEGQLVNSVEDGNWKYFYPNGELKYEATYTNGSMNGILKFYYKNGKVNYELKYVDGQRQGYYKSFFLNGKLETEGYYKDDEQHGAWKFYKGNGSLDVEEFYQEGVVEGKATVYMPDNKVNSESVYRYGFFNNRTLYDTLGKAYHATKLVNGTGDYELVSLTGKPVYKVKYIGGKAHGNAISYFGNGKIKTTENYSHGKLNGISKTNFDNGKMNVQGKYTDGERDSIWTYYFENTGSVDRIITYKDGESEGLDKSFFENGKVEIDRMYKDDVRHGDYTYYGNDGSIIYVGRYVNGVLTAYSWAGKDGDLLPFVKVEHETVNVNTTYPNGNKGMSFKMEKGYLQGDFVVYYADGKKKEDKKFVDGNYEGFYNEYYPNGNLKSKKQYTFDCLDGMTVYYHEDGKVAAEIPYLMDYKHGVAKYYDKTGKLTKKVLFVYGTIYE